MKKIIIIALFLLFSSCQKAALAENLCSYNCSFDDFFRENYENLTENLNPDCDRRTIFNILYNAYSIKFKGLDYEYRCRCEGLENENTEDLTKKCIRDKKRYIRLLADMAIEEYDNFLDDLSFEICGDENFENRLIKKNKKKYRKSLKKMIAKNCK